MELIKRTGKIFTAKSCDHGNTSVFGVEHTVAPAREKVDDFRTFGRPFGSCSRRAGHFGRFGASSQVKWVAGESDESDEPTHILTAHRVNLSIGTRRIAGSSQLAEEQEHRRGGAISKLTHSPRYLALEQA